jgi:hypothetical protein
MRWRNSYFIAAIKLVVLVLIIPDKRSSMGASPAFTHSGTAKKVSC